MLLCTEALRSSMHIERFSNFPNWNPIPIFEALGIARLSNDHFQLAQLLLLGSLFFTLVGWKVRTWLMTSTALYFLVHGQLMGLIKQIGNPYTPHSHNTVCFVLLILSFDRNISKLSSIWNWAGKQFKTTSQTSVSSHSLHLVMITLGIVYLGATYARFAESGFQWMDGFTLKSYLLDAYFSEGAVFAKKLSEHHYVCQALSVLTVLFEASFLFLLFFFRPYWLLGIGGISFHALIFLIMGIDFVTYFGLAYISFLFFPPEFIKNLFSRFMFEVPNENL